MEIYSPMKFVQTFTFPEHACNFFFHFTKQLFIIQSMTSFDSFLTLKKKKKRNDKNVWFFYVIFSLFFYKFKSRLLNKFSDLRETFFGYFR